MTQRKEPPYRTYFHHVRYTEHGTVAHYVRMNEGPYGLDGVALCGVAVDEASDWRGSGTQDEEDTVSTLLVCRRCEQRLGK